MAVALEPRLLIAVAASMLPASRSRVCAAYKACRDAPGAAALEATLAGVGTADDEDPGTIIEDRLRLARASLAAGEERDIEPIAWFDPRYPVLLESIPDPPPVIWVRGSADLTSRPTVAIVGSRAGTEYARQIAGQLAAELAVRGVVVASGLARGVDSAAHRGCVAAGGATVAVLGSGPDRIYPAENRDLAASICRNGTLVSELAPGAPPLPEHFPLRNRLISGISLAVVVVEASEQSGSLITARYALEQGRDVMAVPGSALSGRNRGSHALLKDGAKVVECADDILHGLGWLSSTPVPPRSLPFDSDPLLSRMDAGEIYRLDELILLTGVPGTRLLARLTELELQGRVISTSLGGFARVVAK